MVTKAQDVCDEVLKTLKLSNLCFLIRETPFAVEIKLKKKFIQEFSEPKPEFYEQKHSRGIYSSSMKSKVMDTNTNMKVSN
jgi:hypothetical protein